MTIRLDSNIRKLRQIIDEQRVLGRSIGFVPTMGYLHMGHQSLIEASQKEGHFTVVSVFVNPTQFGPNEDLDAYPRDAERDFQLASQSGADLVWFPEVSDLYAEGSKTMVAPGDLARRMCGLSRPDFFGGICTVVLKFFVIIRPDYAWFGEKDFQQLTIVRRMVADFYLDVEIIGGETIREADGLAMSSRNARLKPEERDLALALYRIIDQAQQAFQAGERDAVQLEARLRASWPKGIDLDYLDLRDPVHLEKVGTLAENTRIFLGAWLNGVRLIDNACVGR